VVAIADNRGGSLLDELLSADPADHDAVAMLAMLERHIPDQGPNVRNTNKCKPLGREIFEFRRGAIRVLWFNAPRVRRLIICTHLFYKQSQKTPRREIEQRSNAATVIWQRKHPAGWCYREASFDEYTRQPIYRVLDGAGPDGFRG
jgi:phage-related protein